MPMATKLFRVVTCCEELWPINMHDTSIEWSCGAMWQIKYISPPAEDEWTPNKIRCWLSVWSEVGWGGVGGGGGGEVGGGM